MSLLEDIKRRNVLRIAGLYLVGAWLIVQVAGTVLPMFDAPAWLPRTIVIVLAIGFIPALVFVWVFELTPEGLKREKDVDRSESITPHTGKALNRIIMVMLALALGVFAFDRFVLSPQRAVEQMEAGRKAGRTEALVGSYGEKSIAVLPFVNMSSDPEQEYFSDGISEEILNLLARIPQMRVISRSSAFSYKGKDVKLAQVAEELNVAHILEGSVRKSSNKVRITAQLIEARSDTHLWSHTWDREINDIFALQTEIATSVAGALKVTLLGDAQEKLAVGGTTNPFAFDAYLRGRHGESIQDEANLRVALAALDEAVALDPAYALAHAFRADVLAQLASTWVRDPGERQRFNADARESADRAVALAPESGFVYSALASVLSSTTVDYMAIDTAYRRSIALEPGNAQLLTAYASYGALFGRADALTAAKRAVVLNPLGVGSHANLGVVLYYARSHEQARAAFRKASALGYNRLTVNWTGVNELASGDPAAALQYCARDLEFWSDQVCLAMAYHKLDRKKEAAAMLEKLKAGSGDGAAYQYAEIYAYWGEPQLALEWLSRAVKLQDGGLLAIKVDPFLDSIRATPQFKDIVSQLDLPD